MAQACGSVVGSRQIAVASAARLLARLGNSGEARRVLSQLVLSSPVLSRQLSSGRARAAAAAAPSWPHRPPVPPRAAGQPGQAAPRGAVQPWTAIAPAVPASPSRQPEDGVAAGYGASSFWIAIKSAELTLAPYVAKGAVSVCLRGGRDESPEVVRKRIQRWEQGLRELGVEIGAATPWGSFANSRYEIDGTDRNNWNAMADWLHKTIQRLSRCSGESAGSAA